MFGIPLIQYISGGHYLDAIAYVAASVAIVFLILPFHEAAHAYTADKLGDPTARNMGRLTLNPMSHIDWLGAALIMLVGFGWAKPVPVNARNFKSPKWGMAVTALAGPLSNLLFGLVALILSNVVLALGMGFDQLFSVNGSVYFSGDALSYVFGFVYVLFISIASINVGLAVFNLIPVPPLDGSRLLTALLPNRLYYKIMQYEQFIMIGLFVIIFVGVLDVPLSYLRNGVMSGLTWLANLPFGF